MPHWADCQGLEGQTLEKPVLKAMGTDPQKASFEALGDRPVKIKILSAAQNVLKAPSDGWQ